MNNYEQKKGLVIGICSAALAVILIVVGLAKGGGVSSPVLMTAAVGGAQGLVGQEVMMEGFSIPGLSKRIRTVNGTKKSENIYTYKLTIQKGKKYYDYTTDFKNLTVQADKKGTPVFKVFKDTKNVYQVYTVDFDDAYKATLTPLVDGKLVTKVAKTINVVARLPLKAPTPQAISVIKPIDSLQFKPNGGVGTKGKGTGL